MNYSYTNFKLTYSKHITNQHKKSPKRRINSLELINVHQILLSDWPKLEKIVEKILLNIFLFNK